MTIDNRLINEPTEHQPFTLADALGGERERPVFSAPRRDWRRALVFLLSMSLLGLHFYPALLLVLVLMINSWRRDRHHFLIQLLLFCGLFALASPDLLVVRRSDVLIVLGWVGLCVVKKNTVEMKRVLLAMVAYFAFALAMALKSEELMWIQLRVLREYFAFVVFTVPIMVFGREQFDAMRFFKLVGVYGLIIMVFYVIDGFVLQGWILIPASTSEYEDSTFYAPVMRPFSFYFPRKYPNGLIFCALLIYPLRKCYRFNWKQWSVVALSFLAMRTMTMIAGFAATYMLFMGKTRRVVLSVFAGLVLLVGLYFVDTAAGGFLRVADTVNQFAMLKMTEDVEDLAEFGSTRGAQIIPKMELLYDQKREWIGFGFIHPELSQKSTFSLSNELYSFGKQEESISQVEETHFQTIINMGYLGLIVQTLFYFGLYFIVAKCRLAKYYLSVLIAVSIFGFGGFAGLNHSVGLFVVAFSFAVVLLDHRVEIAEKRELALRSAASQEETDGRE